MISLDTETTGRDTFHGAKPFFVTTCDENQQVRYWEWDVDPLTREPSVPRKDLLDIGGLIWDAKALVLQNPKFDVAALASVHNTPISWPWCKTHDTLTASHILDSEAKHDLTSLGLDNLDIDIGPLEVVLGEAVKECRRYCRSHLKDWAIAHEHRPDMPSCTKSSGEEDKTWKFDMWLPRTLARALDYPVPDEGCNHDWGSDWLCTQCEGHRFWVVLREYSNADSSVTVALWPGFEKQLKDEGLWEIYEVKRKLPGILYKMEARGVTLSRSRLEEIQNEYKQDVEEAGATCVNIAKSLGYDLKLPKGASPNDSLRGFFFDALKVRPVYDPKGKSGNPTLNKEAMTEYALTLPQNSKGGKFVKNLTRKRKRDTSLTYMAAYQRYWLPTSDPDVYKIHFSLNGTGTGTTRLSCKNPNGQNISRQEAICEKCEGDRCEYCHWTGKDVKSLRLCYGPGPGREWWGLDAKNIERRIPAYKAKARKMIELFERPDDPPYYGSEHAQTAHIILPHLFEQCRDSNGDLDGRLFKKKFPGVYTKQVKGFNFAIQYQCGKATAERTSEVAGSYETFQSAFPELQELNALHVAHANQFGYVETVVDQSLGGSRGYPLRCSRNEYGRVKPTVPLNYHVQGTAGWWMIKAMVRCDEQLDEWNQKVGREEYRMILTIHDELLFDFPKRAHPAVDPKSSNLGRIRVIQRLMEKGGEDIGVPTPVSVGYHEHNWSEEVSL